VATLIVTVLAGVVAPTPTAVAVRNPVLTASTPATPNSRYNLICATILASNVYPFVESAIELGQPLITVLFSSFAASALIPIGGDNTGNT